MLTFVGLGLWDVRDVSVKGLEAVRKADEVYVEFYTSRLSSNIEELEKFFGRKIKELQRSDLEEFGKSATVSWYPSKTPIDVIRANMKIDAHTLLFLDLHPEPMRIGQAIKQLMNIDVAIGELFGVGVARAGSEEAVVKCDLIKRLKDFDFGEPLHVMIVIAKTLHFMEYECLREFADAPKELEKLVV
jgi:diphthamide biosynthesis methyltransferase